MNDPIQQFQAAVDSILPPNIMLLSTSEGGAKERDLNQSKRQTINTATAELLETLAGNPDEPDWHPDQDEYRTHLREAAEQLRGEL